MKLATGILIGIFYVYLGALALQVSSRGWNTGNADLGFWWAVIASLLGIAGLGAIIGSWLHRRPSRH